MLKFDIAAKIVTRGQKAFVVHAGQARRNHALFRQNNIAFLEIPNFGLTPDIAGSTDLLRQATRRHFARRAYVRDSLSVSRPSDNLNDYSTASLGKSAQLAGSIAALYHRMKVGDIVITPGVELIGRYRRQILHFGEISSEFSETDIFEGDHASAVGVPYRRVRWLNTIPRNQVSPALESRIGKPPAVREIEITPETEELLDYSYANYIYDDSSSSVVSAPRYSAENFIALNESGRLIELLTAGYAYATSEKDKDHPAPITDLYRFSKEYYPQAGVENITVEFASPGFWRIIGGTATLAAFVALGITILTSGVSIGEIQAGVLVENSVSGAGTEAATLQETMNFFLQALENDQLAAMKTDGEDASQQIGLETSVRMTGR